ncbi:MAG: glycosyltransferase [Actinomycetota bacterium]
MRVLFVVKGLDIGGLERVVVDLARGLLGQGVAVEVAVANGRRDALVAELLDLEVRVHRLGGTDRIGLSAARRLRRLVCDPRFDVVHVHGPLPAAVVRTTRGRRPVVTTAHTPWFGMRWITRSMWRLTLRADTATVAVANSVRMSFPAHARARMVVLPHGVDLAAAARARASARPSLVGAEVVALVVASHREVKNYGNLLRALRLSRDRGAPLRLVAIGDGPERARNERLAVELGLSDHVDFRSPCGDVWSDMAECDVLVVASDFEGQPLVVVEALAVGLPVVATAVGRVPELVTRAVGRVVPPRDPVALADALTEIACDATLRAELASAAARRSPEWTLDQTVDAHFDLYRSMVEPTAVVPPKQPGRPRVVHLTTIDVTLDWFFASHFSAFQDAGFEVIGMSAPGTHVRALADRGVAHVAVSAFTRSQSVIDDLRAMRQLWRLIGELRPDILHTHNPKPGVLGRIIGRLRHVPLVVNTQHGLYAQPTDPWWRRWPVYSAERLAAACSHVELALNEEDASTLVHRLHVPARRVRLLGNGIDLQRFSPHMVTTDEREHRRAEGGATATDVVFGVVGRLVREKGIADVVEAAALVSSLVPGARWVVVGPVDLAKDDAVDAALVARAEAMGMTFVGARNDMPLCYAAMDVCVSASWREGLPRVPMEAAAMGVPVVATDVRGNRQVVVDGVTGLLVPVRSPGELAAACVRCATNPAGRAAMGAAAVERARVVFDQQPVIERILEVYAALPR